MTYDTIGNDVTMAGGADGALGRIDKYELRRELGEGGFGTVYLARDTVADVDVAVKGLPPEVKHNAVELESIRGNFALVKRLRHPNIVAVTDLHQALSVSYASKDVEAKLRVFERDTMVVMDYALGVTLAQWRRQFPGGKVPVDKAIAVTRQVASALDYAHGQKVLHRDVKPANVMVESADGGKLVARVLDFGLAAEIRSSMGRLSREIRDTSGTRPYMAPEQWKGERQGPATDQYALAAMFYELVVGDVPFASVFDCGDPGVMSVAVTTNAPTIPEDLPKCVRKALAVALAKKPEDRFATCGEFAAALEGKKVSRRGSETQRKSGAGKVLAVLALVAVIGVGWLIYHQSRERRQAERSRLEAESSKGSIEKAGIAVAQPVETKDAPQPTRKDVDAIYVEARVQMGACGRLDSSDGFKSRIEDCQKSFDRAEAQHDIGNWAEAALSFTNVVDECKTLIEQSKARDKAKTAAGILAETIKVAQSAGAKEYAPVRFSSATDLAKRGRSEFDAFKFTDAVATYATAKSQFDLAAQEAGQAKQEEARRKREAEEAAQRAEAERREREAREAAELERKRAEEIEHRRRRLYPEYYNNTDNNAEQLILPKHGDVKTLILPGGATMEMIYVQPGSFTMGSPLREQGRYGHEIQHHVTLTKGFWLGKYEVTQKQWQSVMGTNPSKFKGDNLPVENVSWNDCQDFAWKVNDAARRQFGGGARLPTEAEWEYACRADTSDAYAGTGRLDDMGWYTVNSGSKTHTVGQKHANGWGFHDMHGNVCEWCQDWYGDYGGNSTDPSGPALGDHRVLRGGCWNSIARACRSANRDWLGPGYRIWYFGFRLCCSALP